VAEDLVPLLAKFHRDVLLPDVKRVVAEAVDASEHRLRDEMQGGFDGVAHELKDLRELLHTIYQGFDRLETKYHSIVVDRP
jgi:hypothetical protein